MISKSHFFGNPFIGIFSIANNKVGFCPNEDSGKFSKDIQNLLGVNVIKASIADSPILGVYAALNDTAIIVPNLIQEKELALFKEYFEIVYISESPQNAWGNNLVINNKGGIINPELSEEKKKLEDVLGIEILPLEIAHYKTVGNAVVANDKGFVITYKAREDEIKSVSEILKVNGRKTSINMGGPLPGVGVLANDKGALVGNLSTGVEMANVTEGLDIIE